MISNFNKLFNKIIIEANNYLLTEDYNIFPVPKKLIDDMVEFCLNNHGIEKHYNYNDILTKYTLDWKFHTQYKENLKLMLKNDKFGSIVLYPYKTKNELIKILEKYPNNEINLDNLSLAQIYSYDDNFNLCLLIYTNNISKDSIFKGIQHELIHWMQRVLSSETKNSYGHFNDMKFSLTNNDKEWLLSATFADENVIKYLEQGLEFEPWVANCVENFEHSNYNLDEFQTIIKNKHKFEAEYFRNQHNDDKLELLLFAELCYLSSLNNKSDKRFWYLIEAIKENNM